MPGRSLRTGPYTAILLWAKLACGIVTSHHQEIMLLLAAKAYRQVGLRKAAPQAGLAAYKMRLWITKPRLPYTVWHIFIVSNFESRPEIGYVHWAFSQVRKNLLQLTLCLSTAP
jgi:hypothetical protein